MAGRDMTYDATNRRHVSAATKQAKATEAQRLDIVRGIMSLKPGRAYIYDELAACHVFSTSFSASALQMAFAEGERNRGLRLLTDVIRACPDEYVDMMREANERQLAADRRHQPVESAVPADSPDGDPEPDDGGSFDPIEESRRLLDQIPH